VPGFKKGNIYVIEFGFASCTPCRASIPHLTVLAKKYAGKIQIIGVHIWENNKEKPGDLSYVGKVEQFIQPLGNKIGYAVAVDVPQQTTAERWGGGAPRTFVIGRDGTIAWIGHPDDLEPVIIQLLADSFDVYSTAQKEQENKTYTDSMFSMIWKDKEAGNHARAVALTDSLISKYPSSTWLYYQKYRVLNGMDDNNQRADSLVRWLLRTRPQGFHVMYYLSSELVEGAHPNLDLGIAMADWALDESVYDYASAFILHVKSSAYYKKGDTPKAIELQKKAIALIRPDNTAMRDAKKTLESRLAYYQKSMTHQ